MTLQIILGLCVVLVLLVLFIRYQLNLHNSILNSLCSQLKNIGVDANIESGSIATETKTPKSIRVTGSPINRITIDEYHEPSKPFLNEDKPEEYPSYRWVIGYLVPDPRGVPDLRSSSILIKRWGSKNTVSSNRVFASHPIAASLITNQDINDAIIATEDVISISSQPPRYWIILVKSEKHSFNSSTPKLISEIQWRCYENIALRLLDEKASLTWVQRSEIHP